MNRTTRGGGLAFAGCLAALASGCALSVEGELPDIEVTQHDLVIPGAPAETGGTDPTVSIPSFLQPRDHLALDSASYKSVKVQRVIITSKGSKVTDMSFVRALRMSMGGVKNLLGVNTPAEIVRYQRPAAVVKGTLGRILDMPSSPPAEVIDAWRDPQSLITLEVQGTLPEETWTVDVTVHLSATLSY
jgi:hypothetical protein